MPFKNVDLQHFVLLRRGHEDLGYWRYLSDLAKHFLVFFPLLPILQLCANPLGKKKKNRCRQWSIDRPSCTDSPRSSFLCRRKSGLVCRSPPVASCGDRPRRPGPTAVWCWALLPVRTHTANTAACAPNTAVTKTTTDNSFRPAEVLLRSPERRRWISVPVLLCYPARGRRDNSLPLDSQAISGPLYLRIRLWSSGFDSTLRFPIYWMPVGPMVLFRTQQECNRSDSTCWKVKKAIGVWKQKNVFQYRKKLKVIEIENFKCNLK